MERRTRFYEGVLRHFDANSDGVLDAAEVGDARRRYFAERIMQQAGLDAKFPVSVKAVQEGLKKQSQSGGENSSGTGSSDASTTPLVPGFGVKTDLPAVPGFGERVAGQSSGMGRSSSTRGSSSSSRSSASSGNRDEHRVREHATSLLNQYDKNKNGRLEEDEWRKMSRWHWGADRNGDKVITADELSNQLVDYTRRGSGWGRSSGGSSGSDDEDKRRSYRSRTPAERLPEGLAGWFVDRDADGDGQIAMSEWARDWSDAKAAEFVWYDLNNDGVITPTECLSADKEE